MDQAKTAAALSAADLDRGLARNDRATAAIVKKGITLQQIHGTRYAAEFLRDKRIDLDTVRRILLNLPELRRHDDFAVDVIAAAFEDAPAA